MKRNLLTASILAGAIISLSYGCNASDTASKNPSQFAGNWYGTINAGGQQIDMAINIDETGKSILLDIPQQNAKDIPLTIDYMSADSLALSLAAAGLSYRGRLTSDSTINGTYEQQGMKFKLDFVRGELGDKSERISPQEPQPPFNYEVREVFFENKAAKVVLAGTLIYPEGFKKGQKVPVVLMVTGGGDLDRGKTKPFRVITDYLARNGIASLHYDKRGCGLSTGDFASATISDFADDAACGLDFLKALGDFSQTGVIGHSEGGSVAYILGSRGLTDFLVTMAGPAMRMDAILSYQINAMMQASGASSNPAISVAEARLILLQQDDSPYNRDIIDFNPTVYVQKVACPVFALICDKDLNVDPKMTLESLNKNLQQNPRNQVKVYENLNHIFQHCNPDKPLETIDGDELISPDVPVDIAKWINELCNK
ncbi:MAG: alpha/beta hydrolase [Salinivirgaceae bacterium]|nr:alpha/beta hydrolase [Salinivirgaceae bacterium]